MSKTMQKRTKNKTNDKKIKQNKTRIETKMRTYTKNEKPKTENKT